MRKYMKEYDSLPNLVGVDAVYSSIGLGAFYPHFLYWSTSMVTWAAYGIMTVSKVFIAASPGKLFQ